MKPVIKWPGGKTREIDYIRELIPEFDRYIEPFFGGGAVFFDLMPPRAMINDISNSLILFYQLIKDQNEEFRDVLIKYDKSFQSLLSTADGYHQKIIDSYYKDNEELTLEIVHFILSKADLSEGLVLDMKEYTEKISENVIDKFKRTRKNHSKRKFSDEDLLENLITGFTSGFYMYFRKVYNDIKLDRIKVSEPYNIANFYFIREYCYGSMFRYNKKGEFNIPYGGMSYNRKQFYKKIDSLFNAEIKNIFENVEIFNQDFEDFLNQIELTTSDFIFLDPPYDTDFSDYEGNAFDLEDQKRLCNYLKTTKAKFILIIKDTDFIYNLYKDEFNIISFNKNYTYNVRSRNERGVTHLIITNF